MDGAIILDKAEGISSHSAVVQVRRLLGERRIGHLGTLDPFASGVLVLLIGRATRLARFYGDREKTYEGAIRFGYSTDTYDRTGKRTSPEQSPPLDAAEIRRELSAFIGSHLQQPPPFSAKKVAGIPAYRLARKGEEPQLEAARVTIHELELLSVASPLVAFRTRVSSGTYIRSLAHELGKRLGCGAHLETLRRTAVGEFTERDAVPFEHLEKAAREGNIPLLRMERLLPEFPSMILSAEEARSVSHGNSVAAECAAKWVKLLDESGELIAIAERDAGQSCHPVVVFNSESEV